MARITFRFFAPTIIFILLALHAIEKGAALLPELLWVCQVAPAIVALGILVRRPQLIAIGFLSHLALGMPGYLFDVVATSRTTLLAALAHFVPLIAGGIEFRDREFPRGVMVPCMVLYSSLVLISYWTTDPKLNVNLAHASWPPLATVLPRLWMSWILNAAISLVCITLVERILQRSFPIGRLNVSNQ